MSFLHAYGWNLKEDQRSKRLERHWTLQITQGWCFYYSDVSWRCCYHRQGVCHENGPCAILGLQASMALNLVTPGDNGDCLQVHSLTTKTLVDNNPDVFSGLGLYPNEYQIKFRDDIQLVIQPPRRVTPILHDALKKKLGEMLMNGVITNVEKPTKWVKILFIQLDGSLRLCLDPKDLDCCIERELFQIPTFEEIVSSLVGVEWGGGRRSSALLTKRIHIGRWNWMTSLYIHHTFWKVPVPQNAVWN